ncbi:MAG TPA: hypothetical protein VGE97_10250 [Nitrososphaera sp.]|jgi:hypothetical protein
MDRIFKYHRVDTEKNIDTWEDVEEQLWQWEAEYEDGTILKQFDIDHPLVEFGNNVYPFHWISEIDQKKLKYFHVISHRLNRRNALIWNPKYWKLICLYRHANLVMKVYWDKEHFEKTGKKIPKQVERRKYTAFVYGYETKVGGTVVKNLNVIMPKHEVFTTDNLDNITIDATPIEEWI